jgi:hypothetical protein
MIRWKSFGGKKVKPKKKYILFVKDIGSKYWTRDEAFNTRKEALAQWHRYLKDRHEFNLTDEHRIIHTFEKNTDWIITGYYTDAEIKAMK